MKFLLEANVKLWKLYWTTNSIIVTNQKKISLHAKSVRPKILLKFRGYIKDDCQYLLGHKSDKMVNATMLVKVVILKIFIKSGLQ